MSNWTDLLLFHSHVDYLTTPFVLSLRNEWGDKFGNQIWWNPSEFSSVPTMRWCPDMRIKAELGKFLRIL